jgi:predicted phosphodiesterase
VKLTFISDTHSRHDAIRIEGGDVLIHCGDISNKGSLEDIRSFSEFIKKQDFGHKIVIAGNHDFCFEDERKSEAEEILRENGITYLNDSGIEIDGIKFWGSPIQPEFFDWAFNRKRGESIKKHWDLIPNDTDAI